MSLAAPPRELFRADADWEGGLVEAPALLRRNGTFYLVYSAGRCCGRHCNYATGVARSASLLGPWEKRPAPILTGGNGVRCPGHVGIARGPRRRAGARVPRVPARRPVEPPAADGAAQLRRGGLAARGAAAPRGAASACRALWLRLGARTRLVMAIRTAAGEPRRRRAPRARPRHAVAPDGDDALQRDGAGGRPQPGRPRRRWR